MTDKIFSVWEGVFNSFDEAGGNLDAFDSERWISKQQSLACEAIAKIDEGGSLTKDYPLPLVVAMLLDAHKKISILDFGGGMGIQYFDLIAKVPAAKEKVHYVIVDGESTLENKPSELSEFQNLIFKASLDEVDKTIDIIHIGSTLQYIENWRSLLAHLCERFTPKYFVFSDLLAGDVPTFVSHQIYYEKRIPSQILSIKDFCDELVSKNFYISFASNFSAKILGSTELPNINLPNEYRLKYTKNIVFTKISR